MKVRFTKNTRLNLSWDMHFVQNNRILKSFLSFLPPTPVQNQLIHCEKKIFDLFWYKTCWLTVSYCMNCVPTVLCWPLYFHTFLFFCSHGTVVSCTIEVQWDTLVLTPKKMSHFAGRSNFEKNFSEIFFHSYNIGIRRTCERCERVPTTSVHYERA